MEVVNTGDRRGQEVVQLCLRDPEGRLRRPPQALRGFQKVALDPGASTTVRFALEERDFAAWDDRRGRRIVGSGPYEVRMGTSSRDLPQSTLSALSGGALTEAAIEDLVEQVRTAKQVPTSEDQDRRNE